MKLKITKTFNYHGEMINYIKKTQKTRKIYDCKYEVDPKTKKYTLTYFVQ